ncbi:MAG: nuclease A inhibitor family protein [Pyrinomonadaceae bacterium]
MRKRKRKMVKLKENNSDTDVLFKLLQTASEGLYYMSETDAEITPFVGETAKEVSKEEIMRQTETSPDKHIEERDFAEMFERLTNIQNWFGEEETATVAKFVALKEILEKNLKDLKVFKIGKIELDIYFVGLDAESVLIGIKTKAVET